MEICFSSSLAFVIGFLFFRGLQEKKIPKALYFHGNTYLRKQKMPCPMGGWEKALIAVTHEGKPAYWSDGYIYIITPESQGVSRRVKTFVDRNLELAKKK